MAEFRAAIGRADWGAALAWHRRPFLEEFPLHDVPAFEEWASLERQALLEAWQKAALRHAEGLQEQGEYPQAARLLGELLRQDPLAEDVLQGYLRAAYLAGEREVALRAYERFAQELWRELELKPMEVTVGLGLRPCAARSRWNSKRRSPSPRFRWRCSGPRIWWAGRANKPGCAGPGWPWCGASPGWARPGSCRRPSPILP